MLILDVMTSPSDGVALAGGDGFSTTYISFKVASTTIGKTIMKALDQPDIQYFHLLLYGCNTCSMIPTLKESISTHIRRHLVHCCYTCAPFPSGCVPLSLSQYGTYGHKGTNGNLTEFKRKTVEAFTNWEERLEMGLELETKMNFLSFFRSED